MSSSSSSSAAAADHDPALATSSSSHNLKRLASPTFEGFEGDSRKRAKTNGNSVDADTDLPQTNPALANATQAVAVSTQPTPSSALLDDLEQELLCGCCSALLYRPVIVLPCEHYFCGSCCSLWVRNGGTNCPACRGLSTSVTPSRILQVMVDVLLRADPSRGRTDREKQQADEIYRPGQSFRIPTPREASPEPTIPQTGGEYARPCPHCLAGNRYGWRCPRPVPDPNSDPDNAWHVDDGSPPGHGYCGNCENLLALTAPTTTKCDMCQVSFCGIGIQNRCVALPLMAQHPHGLSDVGDLIQSSEVYDAFDGNAVEVEIMLDYFTAKRISPRDVYREIVEHIQTQPNKFQPLIDLDLFLDVHAVAPGPDPGPNPPRERICRLCATEIVLWGLKDWWIRERRKGELDRSVTERRDCVDGAGCRRQREHGEFFLSFFLPCGVWNLDEVELIVVPPFSAREGM
ncbi:uncharacterized protein STEHIDRAFT_59109 [Stereum hirsutum FP-91666 SS1]|uniref:uncharacterized protein n=1 Tax=Stereum hirsutum (strain FP-91666) TaxID=721885 RepID=UPI00044493D3|nr:uncharacterized protein STEHIDRAFT_59109 [Stereum hirsutum FP-91666 SS1]EIM86010.1 hypothetical protein STEHIDRAFT_59109 [Stereum hirsutum FP-91666 SS1]